LGVSAMGVFLSILAAGGADWLLYAAGGVVVVYMVLRPLAKKRKKDPLEEMPRFGLSQQRGVERDMQNLLVELSEMARQVSAQLDTRAAKLDAFIQEADEKIAELRRLQAEGSSAAPPPAAEPLRDPGWPGQRPAVEETPYNAPVTEVRLPEAASPESRHQEIYRLADSGRSSQEIALQLDRPRGEVELILALRPR